MATYDVTRRYEDLQGNLVDGAIPDDPDAGARNLAAFQNCFDLANRDGGGKVYAPAGTYTIGDGNDEARMRIYRKTEFFGDGRVYTILQQSRIPIDHGEGGPWPSGQKTRAPFLTNNVFRQTTNFDTSEDITIRDLQFRGVYTDGYDGQFSNAYEFYAAIGLSGAERFNIHDCWIEGFHGDGVFIDMYHHPGYDGTPLDVFDNETLIHNSGTIQNCFFKDCLRGGPTIVTGVGVKILHNEMTGNLFGLHLEPGKSYLSDSQRGTICDGNYLHHIWDSGTKEDALANGVNGPLWMASGVSGESGGLSEIKIINNTIEDCYSRRGQAGVGFIGLITLIGDNNIYKGNTHRRLHTGGTIFFSAIGYGGNISNNTFDDCSQRGTFEGASRFLFHRTWPRGATALDAAWNWSNNSFRRCIGPTSTFAGGSFFWPDDSSDDAEGEAYIFANNTISTAGYFYGFRAGFGERVMIHHNHVVAVNAYMPEGDTYPGYRATWRRESSWPRCYPNEFNSRHGEDSHFRDNRFDNWLIDIWPVPDDLCGVPPAAVGLGIGVGNTLGQSYMIHAEGQTTRRSSVTPVSVDPGGAVGSVQYNQDGIFGGVAALIWNDATEVLTYTAQSATSLFEVRASPDQGFAPLMAWYDEFGLLRTFVGPIGRLYYSDLNFYYLLNTDIASLTNLNALIADATLDDSGDARPPLPHTHLEEDITDLQEYLIETDLNTLAKLNGLVTDATLIDDAPATGAEFVRKDNQWVVNSGGGGGGVPGGNDTELQFNQGGNFGGLVNTTFDGTNLSLGDVSTITGTQPTGTDVAAGDLTITPPRSTGQAEPGKVVVAGSVPTAAGIVPQEQKPFWVFGDGRVEVLNVGGKIAIGTNSGNRAAPRDNITIGDNTGRFITGTSNVIVGVGAGQSTDGFGALAQDNVILGLNAGRSIQGFMNVIIGSRVAQDITTAAGNVIIGTEIELQSDSGVGQLSVMNLLTGQASGSVSKSKNPTKGAVGIGTFDFPGGQINSVLTLADNAGDPIPQAGTAGIFAKDNNGVIRVHVVSSDGDVSVLPGAGGGGDPTTPGGVNTQLQFNDVGEFNGTAGLTWNKDTFQLRMQAQSGNILPLTINGAPAQSANLTEWTDDQGNLQSYVDQSGRLRFGSGGLQYIVDAPADGLQYARQDNAWTVVTGGGPPPDPTPPGGADEQLQYNNDGTFGGLVNSVWDGTRLLLGDVAQILGRTRVGTDLDAGTLLFGAGQSTGAAPPAEIHFVAADESEEPGAVPHARTQHMRIGGGKVEIDKLLEVNGITIDGATQTISGTTGGTLLNKIIFEDKDLGVRFADAGARIRANIIEHLTHVIGDPGPFAIQGSDGDMTFRQTDGKVIFDANPIRVQIDTRDFQVFGDNGAKPLLTVIQDGGVNIGGTAAIGDGERAMAFAQSAVEPTPPAGTAILFSQVSGDGPTRLFTKDSNSQVQELMNLSQVGHTHTESDITDLKDYLTDAPSDGNLYGRRDGNWDQVTGGGEGVPEAPTDGVPYSRQDANWVPSPNAAGGITGQFQYLGPDGTFAAAENLIYNDFARSLQVLASNQSQTSPFTVVRQAGNTAVLTDWRDEAFNLKTHVDNEGLLRFGDTGLLYLREDMIATLGLLNAFVQDATLDDASDPRPPTAHTHTEADITDLGDYLGEAPTDGQQYVRQSSTWVVNTGGVPAGDNLSLQYNDNGSFAGIPNSFYEGDFGGGFGFQLSLVMNLCIGGRVQPAAPAVATLSFDDNGGHPAFSSTNSVAFYCTDNEAFVINDRGQTTQLSSHDKEGNYVLDTQYQKEKKRVTIEVEKFFRDQYPQYVVDQSLD